jgi:hypothetical protein
MRLLSWSSLIAALLFSVTTVAQPPSKYPPIKPGRPLPEPAPPTPTPEPAPPPAAKPSPAAAKAPAAKPAPAAAEDSIMADNTHSMWVALGFGPNIGIVGCVRRLCNYEQRYTQFKLTEDFGFHVSGSDGFAIGASLQEAFGNDVFRLTAAFKMWWDAPISDDLALYLTPMFSAGYSLLHFDFGALGAITDHAFNMQGGIGLRMVLVDRVMVYVRPLTADVSIGADGVSMFYDIAVGGGITFTP